MFIGFYAIINIKTTSQQANNVETTSNRHCCNIVCLLVSFERRRLFEPGPHASVVEENVYVLSEECDRLQCILCRLKIGYIFFCISDHGLRSELRYIINLS